MKLSSLVFINFIMLYFSLSGDSVVHAEAGDEIKDRKSGNAFAPDWSGQPDPHDRCSWKGFGRNEKQQSQENSEIFINDKKMNIFWPVSGILNLSKKYHPIMFLILGDQSTLVIFIYSGIILNILPTGQI